MLLYINAQNIAIYCNRILCFMKIEPQTFTEKVKCEYNLINVAFKYLCTLKFNNILPY